MKTKIFVLLISLASLFMVACEDEVSSIGMGLQDPSTLYDGKCDTLYCSAETVLDDSLLTTGYSSGLLGYYQDNTFGQVEASIFAQIVCGSESGIDYENSTIDSIVLSLGVTERYPSNSNQFGVGTGSLNSHDVYNYRAINLSLRVKQLNDTLSNHLSYYATDSVATRSGYLYNGTVVLRTTDTAVRIRLNNQLNSQLEGHKYTNQEFIDALKGLYISMPNYAEPRMLTVNFAAAATKLTIYRTYHQNSDTSHLEDAFSIGEGAVHFNRYRHNYTGALSAFNTDRNASVAGSRYLYLEPMGGTKLKLDFDAQLRAFHEAHPFAIVHYAELVLPTASDMADNLPPTSLLALRNWGDTNTTYVADMSDGYSSTGFDGSYNTVSKAYRLRLTQHVQKLLRAGKDEGTYLVINSRRASARRTVLNGSDPVLTQGNGVRLVLIYSEPL